MTLRSCIFGPLLVSLSFLGSFRKGKKLEAFSFAIGDSLIKIQSQKQEEEEEERKWWVTKKGKVFWVLGLDDNKGRTLREVNAATGFVLFSWGSVNEEVVDGCFLCCFF